MSMRHRRLIAEIQIEQDIHVASAHASMRVCRIVTVNPLSRLQETFALMEQAFRLGAAQHAAECYLRWRGG
jgi:hypothetical protein